MRRDRSRTGSADCRAEPAALRNGRERRREACEVIAAVTVVAQNYLLILLRGAAYLARHVAIVVDTQRRGGGLHVDLELRDHDAR